MVFLEGVANLLGGGELQIFPLIIIGKIQAATFPGRLQGN